MAIEKGQKYGVIILLFICVFFGILFFNNRVGNAPLQNEIIVSKNSVTVESQSAGTNVIVKELSLDERLWVVVYE